MSMPSPAQLVERSIVHAAGIGDQTDFHRQAIRRSGVAVVEAASVAAGAVVGGTGTAGSANPPPPPFFNAARSILAVNRTDRTRQSLFDILTPFKIL